MNLFGESDNNGGPPKPKKKRAKPPETDGSTKRCIDAFYEAYVRKWSPPAAVAAWEADRTQTVGLVTPLLSGGKHGRKFKELVAAWDEATVLALIWRFFATTDPQITRTDYSYDAFFAKASYLRLADVRHPVSDRTRENLAAAARVLGLERTAVAGRQKALPPKGEKP